MVEDEYRGFKFIGNLSCSTNDTSLKQAAFEKFGHHLVVDKFSRGFGIVSNFEDEKKALEEAMNGIDLDGRDRDRNRDHRHGSGGTISSLPILLGNAPGVADMVEGMTNMKIDDDKTPPVLAPKKEEPVENTSPLQETTSGAPSSFKSKRQNINAEESKTTNGPPLKKKVKSEDEGKSVKDETASASKSNAPPKGAPSTSTPSSEPVTEDEIRAFLTRRAPVTTLGLVAKFKSRLMSKEDKDAFAAVLRRISKIQKIYGANFVVLREK